MSKNTFLVLVAGALLAPALAFADTASDLHITPDGTVTGSNIVVMQKAGSGNFFTRATWGSAFVRITVLAHDDTIVTKEHGEGATSDVIQEGDTIDFDGTLAGGDSLVVNAKHVRDHSLQQAQKTLSGKIVSVNMGAQSFVLSNTMFGTTSVIVPSSVDIQKSARVIAFGDLVAGDKVLSVSGTYNYQTNALTASSMSVYQDPSVFVARNFQGTLKSISGSALPVTLVVTVGGTDYTVALPATASVLNTAKAATKLARFQVGDTVRLYGSIRKTDLSSIDATIVRDLTF